MKEQEAQNDQGYGEVEVLEGVSELPPSISRDVLRGAKLNQECCGNHCGHCCEDRHQHPEKLLFMGLHLRRNKL